jgi:hypothetical protein
MKVTAMQ